MNRTLIAVIAVLITCSIQAQTVNGIPVEDIEATYIELIHSSPNAPPYLGNGITVLVDFGQNPKEMSDRHAGLKDANGDKMAFNSMVEAMNFFAKYGYELIQAYTVPDDGRHIRRYIMRKSGS